MTALSHSYSFIAGTPAIASEINSNFAATRSIVNGQLADDNFAATAGMYTAYRALLAASGVISADLAAATYYFGQGTVIATSAGAGNVVNAGGVNVTPRCTTSMTPIARPAAGRPS